MGRNPGGGPQTAETRARLGRRPAAHGAERGGAREPSDGDPTDAATRGGGVGGS